MGKNNIEKFSLGYRALSFWGMLIHSCLYSKRNVFNRPKKTRQPHILVSNHQNALMDAMAILFSIKETTVFLARSDIFKNSKIAYWLYFLRVLPIYRMRDGYENLKQNDAAFATTLRVINHPCTVALFPEGSHTEYKRLRPFQKGFARLAFQAIEKNGNKNFQIIPTGIDYEDFQKFGTKQTVNFGQPINVEEYYDIYIKNQAAGLNALKSRMHSEIKKLMIHVESERWYELTLKLIKINTHTHRNKSIKPIAVFEENQQIATVISTYPDTSDKIQNLETTCNKLFEILTKHNLEVETLSSSRKIFANLGILIILLPVFTLALPAFITLGWAFILIRQWANAKIKDTQFRTSVRYALYVLLSIALILLLPLLLLLFAPAVYYPVGTVSLALSSLIALRTLPFMKKKAKALKSSLLNLIKNSDINKALQCIKDIQKKIKELKN